MLKMGKNAIFFPFYTNLLKILATKILLMAIDSTWKKPSK